MWTAKKSIVLKYVTATVGDRVSLSCTTKLPTPVDWYYQQSEHEEAVVICWAGNIGNGYSRHFTILRKVQGDYSLIIPLVSRGDEGVYTCLEDAGHGLEHRVELTVHGK